MAASCFIVEFLRSVPCVVTDDKEPLRQQMNKKMESDTSKEIYKDRKIIVEPVFGQIKNTGFKEFSVRGYDKTSGEFSLVCCVHNVKKIMKAMFRGVVRSKSGKLEQVTA
jgi:transposase